MRKAFKLIRLLKNLIFHPAYFSIVLLDYRNKLHPAYSDDEHLEAAMKWLTRAQDAAGSDGGCAGIYTFEKGWSPPYPETTGYIIPTFLEYGKLTNSSDYIERAIRMGDWEIDIQLPSGAVRGGVGLNQYPIVFNTGQVMLGWVALYHHTNDKKYLNAAEKAAWWLAGNQDEDGKWSKNTYNGIPHAYNVRVTWALLKVAGITDNSEMKEAAEKNIRWVLLQSDEKAWFDHMGFTIEEDPLTHTIAYTLRGLLECSFLVENDLKEEILYKVNLAAEQLVDQYEEAQNKPGRIQGFLPGTFRKGWQTAANFSCLTGNVQMAIIWIKLYQLNGNKRFYDAAVKSIEQLKTTQHLTSRNEGIRGGIAGSYPIWGKYVNFGYPNWAAKFFADAIMLKKKIKN